MCHVSAVRSAVAGRKLGRLYLMCRVTAVTNMGIASLQSSTSTTDGVLTHADAEGTPGSQHGAAAGMDEKELAQRDAHIRSFAIAQVLQIPGHTSYDGSAAGLQTAFLLVKILEVQVSWQSVCRRHCCGVLHKAVL